MLPIGKGKRTEVEAGEASNTRDHTRSRTNSMASVPGAFEDEAGDQTIIGPEATSEQGIPGEAKQPDDDLQRIKTIAIRYRAERNVDRDRATAFEEQLAHTSAENMKLRDTIRKLQAGDLYFQPTVEDPVEGKRSEQPQVPQNLELPLHTVRDTPARAPAVSGISGPPDSLTVNWRPRGRDPKESLKGESPDEYPPWRYAVLLKLKTDALQFPDEDTKIGYALSQMKQPIFDNMFTWVFDRGDSITLHDLFDEIEHYLGYHLQEREARKSLISIAQRPDEPISEYYHRIYKLWQKAKTTETERVEKLLTTMLPYLSAPLIARGYKGTRELLDDARTVEDRKKDVAFSHPRNKARVTTTWSGSVTASNSRLGEGAARTRIPDDRPLTRSGATGTSTPNSNSPRSPNARFGPVAKKPDGWVGTWYDPVRSPRKMDAEEKTSMTRQGRCWMCRGSGHRGADACCPSHVRNQERKLNAMATESLSEESSDEETSGKA
jgi:hypothetical protein